MKVSQVVNITKGTLLNTPSIDMFSRIICDINKIQKGDLYISLQTDFATMAHAALAGAYGIISEKKIEFDDKIAYIMVENIGNGDTDGKKIKIGDSEIAYIMVENIQDCLMRLIRYQLLAKHIMFISFSPIEKAIAKNIIDDEGVYFFDDNLATLIELANKEAIKFIITDNQEALDLGFHILQPNKPKEHPFLVLSYTLFDSTILYKEMQYRINLPKLFFNELSRVLYFCEEQNIHCSLEHFKHISFFKPNFLNVSGKIIEYGQASKVAIAEEDIEQFKRYMAYIANNATWGKILFIVPQVYVELFNQITQTLAYSSEEELCQHIYETNFNFALILGINDENLVYAINKNYKEVLEPDLFSGSWNEAQQLL